jgi:hypothetical protein
MRLLPTSPRLRRRLGWLGAACLAAAALGTVVVVLPEKNAPRTEGAAPSPPDVSLTDQRTVPLRKADRRAINRTLDRFVSTAVVRRHVADSYELATPTLRAGTTRRQWAAGEIPVYPYPAAGQQFHGWRLAYSYANEVGLDLLIQPRTGAKTGPISFEVSLKRIGGRWLVNSFVPGATFSAPKEKPVVLAAKDFTPNPVVNTVPKKHLGTLWIVLPLALLGLVLLAPLSVFVVHWQRDRRAMRRYREEAAPAGRDRLPPLSASRR